MSREFSVATMVSSFIVLIIIVMVGASVYPAVQRFVNDSNVTGSPVAPVVSLIPLFFWLMIGIGILFAAIHAFVGPEDGWSGESWTRTSTESEPQSEPEPEADATRCAYCGGKVHRVRRVHIDAPEPDLPEWLETCPWCYAPADKAFPEGVRE